MKVGGKISGLKYKLSYPIDELSFNSMHLFTFGKLNHCINYRKEVRWRKFELLIYSLLKARLNIFPSVRLRKSILQKLHVVFKYIYLVLLD